MIDAGTCEAAMKVRDPSFDGLFFVGVKTTGIYCRPVCTARMPRRENIAFYPSAASAERAGLSSVSALQAGDRAVLPSVEGDQNDR